MKKERIFLIVVVVVFSWSCNSLETGDSCKSFGNTYSKMLDRGVGHQELLKKINDLISKDSKCIDAFLTRGDIYVEIDSLRLARQDYVNVLQLDTGNVYALYQLGVIANLNNKYDSAVYYLEHAMRLKQVDGVIMNFRTDNPSVSVNKYDVDASNILYLLGIAYYYKNDIKNAFDQFEYCIEHKYSLPTAYLYRGALYITMKQNEKACDDFRQSVELGNSQAIEYQVKYCDK